MAQKITFTPNQLKKIRTVDERLMSYNIEMTEITGGTFWKAYTPGQIAGTEEFKVSGELTDFTAMADLTQTKKIFNLSHEYGVDIDAAEFMNEPNMLEMSGALKGYTAADFVRDQDIFNGWVRENYPNCLIVALSATVLWVKWTQKMPVQVLE